MALNPMQKRAAARLYSELDLLTRRQIKHLEPPFGMNIGKLGQWRERLVMVADLIDKVRTEARQLLIDPEEFFELVREPDEMLEFAAVEYPAEEYRAQLEERAAQRIAAEKRAAEDRELFRKAGMLLDEEATPEQLLDADAMGEAQADDQAEADAEPSEVEQVAEAAEEGNEPAEDAEDADEREFDPDADMPDFVAGFTLMDEEGNAFPVPPLDERRMEFGAGYLRLTESLATACRLVLRWASEEAPVFRADPLAPLEPVEAIELEEEPEL